jgi:hypothetical protein
MLSTINIAQFSIMDFIESRNGLFNRSEFTTAQAKKRNGVDDIQVIRTSSSCDASKFRHSFLLITRSQTPIILESLKSRAMDQNGAIPATAQPTRNPKITPELRKGSPAWGRSREVVIRARKPR